MATEIPKLTEYGHQAGSPGWFQPTQGEWIGDEHVIHKLKPVIRCNCGNFCGIGLHHVHPDGTVTASFYHKKGTNYAIGESEEGCEWHVWLKLLDYDGGEFLPTPKLPDYKP
jgi:hypothetical protein